MADYLIKKNSKVILIETLFLKLTFKLKLILNYIESLIVVTELNFDSLENWDKQKFDRTVLS